MHEEEAVAEDYDDSPELAHAPLDARGVNCLLRSDGRFFTRDPARVRHLLSSMAATMATHTRVVRQLHADVDRISQAGRNRSAPLTAAVQALGQLSVDEQRQVVDVQAGALTRPCGMPLPTLAASSWRRSARRTGSGWCWRRSPRTRSCPTVCAPGSAPTWQACPPPASYHRIPTTSTWTPWSRPARVASRCQRANSPRPARARRARSGRA